MNDDQGRKGYCFETDHEMFCHQLVSNQFQRSSLVVNTIAPGGPAQLLQPLHSCRLTGVTSAEGARNRGRRARLLSAFSASAGIAIAVRLLVAGRITRRRRSRASVNDRRLAVC